MHAFIISIFTQSPGANLRRLYVWLRAMSPGKRICVVYGGLIASIAVMTALVLSVFGFMVAMFLVSAAVGSSDLQRAESTYESRDVAFYEALVAPSLAAMSVDWPETSPSPAQQLIEQLDLPKPFAESYPTFMRIRERGIQMNLAGAYDSALWLNIDIDEDHIRFTLREINDFDTVQMLYQRQLTKAELATLSPPGSAPTYHWRCEQILSSPWR